MANFCSKTLHICEFTFSKQCQECSQQKRNGTITTWAGIRQWLHNVMRVSGMLLVTLLPWEQQGSEDGFLGKYATFLSSWRATEMLYNPQGKKPPSVVHSDNTSHYIHAHTTHPLQQGVDKPKTSLLLGTRNYTASAWPCKWHPEEPQCLHFSSSGIPSKYHRAWDSMIPTTNICAFGWTGNDHSPITVNEISHRKGHKW